MKSLGKSFHFHIGLRTVKTAVAVMLAMVLVDAYGASDSKLIFAMLGAMDAVQPTFKGSVKACLTQVVGVTLGALIAIILLQLPIGHIWSAGIGIVTVITLYNVLGIHFSPSLPCFIVVTLCTTENIVPTVYALGRIWDSLIGLGVGMVINTAIFPYDNRRKIRHTVRTLDRELIRFLEELFDGDEVIPDAQRMSDTVSVMAAQLTIFSDQRFFLHRKRQKQDLESYRICASKAKELLARMQILSTMGKPGRLNADNRRRLAACGAGIRDDRPLDAVTERDVVTNYHVAQILKLRRELLAALKK